MRVNKAWKLKDRVEIARESNLVDTAVTIDSGLVCRGTLLCFCPGGQMASIAPLEL